MGYQVKVGSFKVDVFFIIAIAVCVVLYFIFDDKRYDIMATSVMIAGFVFQNPLLLQAPKR